MDFLSLPVVMVENIISYLTYDEIARCRIVCKYFDEICQRMLNIGFVKVERRHNFALKSVKAQLPRRESERRYHPLSRHCDILTSIETRISMLNMTYSKFIDNNMCCFIPGRVIDEIQRVLTVVENNKTPPRAHEVLQELRDISSMAIEHFDDKISPAFRKKLRDSVATPPTRQANNALAPLVIRQEMMNLRKKYSINTRMTIHLFDQYKGFYVKMLKYKKLAWNQCKFLKQMHRRLRRQDNCIAELKRRIEECDIKYNELTHKNQTVDVKVQAAGDVASSSAQGLRNFGSQIKLDLSVLPIGTSKRNQSKLPNIMPRKPQIRLPSLSDYDSNGESSRPNSPQPSSSSTSSPRPAGPSQATLAKMRGLAKIRGLAKEIQQLSNRTLIKSKAMDMDLNKRLECFKKMENAGKRKLNIATDTEDLQDTKKPKKD